ncbi:MAG: DUF58 domain-containing protein [Myxococcales bacterium]|nr:DUF58 domain-containing protein [Myxococcales bacterium]
MDAAPARDAENRVMPTRDGAVYLALLGGVGFGAVNTGNNLIYLVLGLFLAVLVVANVLAEWNLRGLRVERRLPGEIFAEVPGIGSYVLMNSRGRGAAWHVRLSERGHTNAGTFVEHCPAGATTEVRAIFTLFERGPDWLSAVRVESTFPFGLVRRWRDVELPCRVLVYPRPTGRGAPHAAHGEGDEAGERGRPAGSGDFAGLRPYQPGDPLRRVHWPTSARAGQPMVVVRIAEGAADVLLVLDPGLAGPRREEAIRRLAGGVDAHLAAGDAVGLEADGLVLSPRGGGTWRRRLLTVLAELEHR